MSDPMMASLQRLLDASLTTWQLDGRTTSDGHEISVRGDVAELIIARAPDGMPFRWVVTVDGGRRTAASINGVLRIVRQTLAPGYEPLSLRIAPPVGLPNARATT